MFSVRAVLVVSVCILCAAMSPRGAGAVATAGQLYSPLDEQPLDGLLPQQDTLVGRLTFNSQSEPGTSGWELRRQGKAITLDVSAVQARAERLRGQRVRMEGHFVFAGLGRTFVVTRIRRA